MTPMLSFENVNVAIAGAPVLRNVSFSLQPGASAALIGRNGAGKTTTVRTIMGFTEAQSARCGWAARISGPSRRTAGQRSVSAMRPRTAGCFRLSRWRRTSCFPAASRS